jgi:hypothetical protein
LLCKSPLSNEYQNQYERRPNIHDNSGRKSESFGRKNYHGIVKK